MTAYIQRLLHVESVSEHYLMTDSDIPHKQEWATSKMPLRSFQTDAVCPAVHMNTTSHFHANETNFYECCAPSLALKKRNLEMAYFPLHVEQEVQSELTVWKA